MVLYLLAIAGVGELSAYVTLASGESQPRPPGEGADRNTGGPRLVGPIRLRPPDGRLSYRSREIGKNHWWAATGSAALLLMTLTQLSHAAAEGRFLPFLADWLHVAAATIWAGGLLSLVVIFDSGSLEAIAAERRQAARAGAETLLETGHRCRHGPRRHTGLYAILLHVPNLAALWEPPTGAPS